MGEEHPMRALILGLTLSFTIAALPARGQVDKPTPAPILDAAAVGPEVFGLARPLIGVWQGGGT